jgi:hypothetical protein
MLMDKQSRVKYFTELIKREPYSHKDIYYQGQKRKLPVYQIDLDYLVYNQWNGRIASLVKSHFKETGVEIDATDPHGIELIERFLWRSNEPANQATEKSIFDQGQNEYGIVTRDGVVIDGNRRSMILKRVAKKKRESPVYFLGVVLNDTLDDNPKEIMRLETTYQMGEDAKVDYSPIEKYLKCKDLVSYGFTTGEIAKMMGDSEPTIKEYLSIMGLMDDYLVKLGYSEIYTRLEKTEGAFVDLNNYLNRYKSGKSKIIQWNYEDSDLNDLKLIYFDYIRGIYNRSKTSSSESGDSKDYRFIGQTSKKGSFFSNEDVWKKFRDSHFENVDKITDSEPDIESDRQQNPGMTLDEILKNRDVRWSKKVDSQLKRNMGLSREALDNLNKQNAPLELLESAKLKLDSINTEVAAFLEDKAVYDLIREINQMTYEFSNLIKAHKKKS